MGGCLQNLVNAELSQVSEQSLYPYRGQRTNTFRPNTKPLLAFFGRWSVFQSWVFYVLDIIGYATGCEEPYKTCGIGCDLSCSICGAYEESTNHVLFECPTALQTWALSRILPLRQFFHHLQFSLVWIIYSGDCRRRMFLVISLEYYGIYGRQEMIRFTRTEMETRWRFFGWLTWNVRRLN